VIRLPTSDELATVTSGIAQTMCGLVFNPIKGKVDSAKMWRMAVLPIKGAQSVKVAVGSDQLSGAALGHRMFALPISNVDPTMAEDALCELVNMVAGRLKRLMSVDDSLGLPTLIRENAPIWENDKARSVLLRGDSVELYVQVVIE
jgi:hypothetical protein